MRSAYRTRSTPDNHNINIGYRLALSARARVKRRARQPPELRRLSDGPGVFLRREKPSSMVV